MKPPERDGAAGTGLPQSAGPEASRLGASRRVLTIVLVVLVLLSAGLFLWAGNLERRLSRLAAPEINLPLFELLGSNVTRSLGSSGRKLVELPPSCRFYTLVLTAPSAEEKQLYRVEIRREEDSSLAWEGSGLEINHYGSFTLMLPRNTLASGDFTLGVYEAGADSATPIEEYAFTLNASEAVRSEPTS